MRVAGSFARNANSQGTPQPSGRPGLLPHTSPLGQKAARYTPSSTSVAPSTNHFWFSTVSSRTQCRLSHKDDSTIIPSTGHFAPWGARLELEHSKAPADWGIREGSCFPQPTPHRQAHTFHSSVSKEMPEAAAYITASDAFDQHLRANPVFLKELYFNSLFGLNAASNLVRNSCPTAPCHFARRVNADSATRAGLKPLPHGSSLRNVAEIVSADKRDELIFT